LGQGDVRQSYLDHAEARDIETEFYPRIDPENLRRDEPEETAPPQRTQDRRDYSGPFRVISYIIFIAFAGAVAFLIFQNMGPVTLGGVDRDKNERRRQAPAYEEEELAARSKAYATRNDRVEAVEDMLAEAFERAQVELDLVFGEADTARELERRLRQVWRQHAPLKTLVQASEQSQFAGIALSADQYAECVTAYRTIMGAGA
jgi:hypothetical protein